MSTFLFLSLIVALVYIIIQNRKAKAKEAELSQLRTTSEQQAATAVARESQLQREVDQLSQYRTIVDAEQYAQQIRSGAQTDAKLILSQARSEAVSLRSTADEELRQARGQAKDIRDQAGAKARSLQTQADVILLDASKEASRIVTIANQRAEEIAGEALAASRNAGDLERTIQALKNTINGYGLATVYWRFFLGYHLGEVKMKFPLSGSLVI